MRRPLLFPLLAVPLALGLFTLGPRFAEWRHGPVALPEESGLLSTSQGAVRFTLYFPEEARRTVSIARSPWAWTQTWKPRASNSRTISVSSSRSKYKMPEP